MNTKFNELPISFIKDNTVGSSINNKKHFIYEIFPSDQTQMSSSEKESYMQSCITTLLEMTNNSLINSKEEALLQRVKATNKKESFKFYKLEDKILLESEKETKAFKSQPITNFYDFFLSGNDDFYSDIVFGQDYFKVNGHYFRLINCYDFPEDIDSTAFNRIGNYIVNITRKPQHQAIEFVKRNRKLHIGNLTKSIRDIESENAYGESELVLESLIANKEGLFSAECWFIVKAHSEDVLNYETLRILEDLKLLQIAPLIETSNALKYLTETIFFGVEPSFKRAHDVCASFLVKFLPFHHEKFHDEGVELLSRDGSPIYLNIFDEDADNFNVSISGSSGGGKSVFAQKLTDHSRALGRSVVIIDKGESFLKFAEYYEANIFSKQINPMHFKNPLFLKEFVLTYIPPSEITTKEKGLIFTEISNAINDGVQTFYDLILHLEKFSKGITYYFAEIWPYITNDPVTSNKITYIDLSIYPESIIPSVILFAIEYFKSLGTEEDFRILLIDECWKLLSKNHDYISECFRTFRKYGCSAIAITQGVNDLIELGDIGGAILDNSFFRVTLNQTLSEKAKAFFTDYEVNMIDSVASEKGKYSEFLISTSEHTKKKIFRYYASDFEYQMFNTNKHELRKWNAFKSKFGADFKPSQIFNAFTFISAGE